jgi:hypothetical protein
MWLTACLPSLPACPARPALLADDEYSSYQKVGRRRRSKQRVAGQYGAKNAGGGKVPRERALVPTAGVPLRPWQREQ